jgi:hypothetical protein
MSQEKVVALARPDYKQISERIQMLNRQGLHAEALKESDEALSGHTRPDSTTASIFFSKAIALDLMERTEEAFPIFLDLCRLWPECSEYHRSFRIVCANLAKIGAEMLESYASGRHTSPDGLLAVHEILWEHGFVSFALAEWKMKHDVLKGEKALVRRRMEAYLALSPNDPDFVEAAIDLALLAEDIEGLEALGKHIENRSWRKDHQARAAKFEARIAVGLALKKSS